MKKIFFVPALAIFLTTACKNKSEAEEQTTTPVVTPVNTTNNAQPAVTTTPVNTTSVINATPTVNQPASTPVNIQMPAATTTTTASTAAGLNPAHGQPGHRCDIAVGAPLNSPPGANPNVRTTTAPPTTQTMSTISTAPVI